jgi:TetR/AcrR family transcriptional regulator, cholesterol catabolism regulator
MKEKVKTKKATTREPVVVSTQIKNIDLVERRRRELISAATKIFIEKGYHQTSIRDIAKATSFSMGNLYDYIRTKEDILYLVHQDMIHNVYRTLFEIQGDEFENRSGDLTAIIRTALEKTFDFQEEIILLYRESGSLSKEMLHSILELETRYLTMFKKLLDEANKQGLTRIEDTHFFANLVVYLLSFLSLRRWSLKDYSRKQAVNLLMGYIQCLLISGKETSPGEKASLKRAVPPKARTAA